MVRKFKQKYIYTESKVNPKLNYWVNRVGEVLDVDELLSTKEANKEIIQYYKSSRFWYNLLNSSKGYLHCALSEGVVIEQGDYDRIPDIVKTEILTEDSKKIVELAPGRGINSLYLIERVEDIDVKGIELSNPPDRRLKRYLNYKHLMGDYHDLTMIEDNSIDLVFVVEALCYSQNKVAVFEEVSRILKKGGKFIIFDGYTNDLEEIEDEYEKMMIFFLARGMALKKFENYDSVENAAHETGFKLVKKVDLSKQIKNTAAKFEFYARAYFRNKMLARIIFKLLGSDATKNSVSGLFMNAALERGLASYYLHIFQKV